MVGTVSDRIRWVWQKNQAGGRRYVATVGPLELRVLPRDTDYRGSVSFRSEVYEGDRRLWYRDCGGADTAKRWAKGYASTWRRTHGR